MNHFLTCILKGLTRKVVSYEPHRNVGVGQQLSYCVWKDALFSHSLLICKNLPCPFVMHPFLSFFLLFQAPSTRRCNKFHFFPVFVCKLQHEHRSERSVNPFASV